MIIHLMLASIHTREYIKFIKDNFEENTHSFIIYAENNPHKIEFNNDSKTKVINSKNELIKFYLFNKELKKAKKIIIHGFYWPYLGLYYFIYTKLLKKSCWVMWGADLHIIKKRTTKNIPKKMYYLIENYIKKNMGNILYLTKDDYKLAKNYYGVKGKGIQVAYTNGLDLNKIEQLKSKKLEKEEIFIQIGNSASPENNHIEIIDKLKPYKDRKIKIFVPLSYEGDDEYKERVIKYGQGIFREKFIPLFNFLEFDDYIKYLSKIDILVFNHNRQQGLGNIFLAAYMNKKIYLKKNGACWNYLKNDLEIKVYDFEKFNIDLQLEINNKKKISETIYSKEFIKKLWMTGFN